jgi:hypothetical protein
MASPFEDLATALEAQTALTTLSAKVFAHAAGLAKHGSPRRIVLLPTAGAYSARSTDDEEATRDSVVAVEAHIWGRDDGDAWDLHEALIEALEQQAHGDITDEDDAGDFYQLTGFSYPTEPDTAKHGGAIVVRFDVTVSLMRAALARGRVDDFQLTEG